MSAKCHDISHPIVVANCANIPNMRLHIRAERMGSNTCTRWRVVQCAQLMMTRRSQGWINSDWEVMLPTLLCPIDCGKHSCDDKFVHGGDNIRCGGCRDASKAVVSESRFFNLETRTRVSPIQSRSSKRDREFLTLTLKLRDETEKKFPPISGIETRSSLSDFETRTRIPLI